MRRLQYLWNAHEARCFRPAGEVSKLAGQEVARHLMVLEEPIKEVGLYEVSLRLTHNMTPR